MSQTRSTSPPAVMLQNGLVSGLALGIWGGFGCCLCPGELLQQLLLNLHSVGDCGAPQLGLPWQTGVPDARWGISLLWCL